MADISNELIYEVLKAMQSRLGLIEDGQREIRSELKSMRIQLQAVQVDIGNMYDSLATVDHRITRIERRLDLADVTAQ